MEVLTTKGTINESNTIKATKLPNKTKTRLKRFLLSTCFLVAGFSLPAKYCFILTDRPSSAFFSGAIHLLEHYRNDYFDRIRLFHASARTTNTLAILCMESLFEIVDGDLQIPV